MLAVHPAFAEFRELVAERIRELERSYPEWQSTEHYLLRYLRALHQRASSVATPHDMEDDMRTLLRFYVDVIEEGSTADKIYKEILESHRYALRRLETADR